MFGFFRPNPPLGTWEKVWTETRFAELVQIVGPARLHSATVLLPTDEFFPEAFAPQPHDPHVLLEAVRRHLQLDVGEPRVEIIADAAPDTMFVSSEHWDDPSIRVRESLTNDAEDLISALVCELGRIFLARGGHYTAGDPDGPWAAELLSTVIGAGVFVANSVLYEENIDMGRWSRWNMERRGNVPARILGYAMALFAWARGERPTWSRYLRKDAASVMHEGLRYLQRTNDSLFQPQAGTTPYSNLTLPALLDELQAGTPSQRMAALWELEERREEHAALAPAVLRCLRDRDEDLRGQALRTLAVLGAASDEVEAGVFMALRDKSDHVRIAAADAIAALGAQQPDTLDELALMLEDSNLAVISAAARALARFGPQAQHRTDLVLKALRRGLIACQETMIASAVEALCAIEVDPAYCLCETFAEDGEFLDRAVRALRAYGPDGRGAIE